jgi:hypothetical protein
MYSIKHHPHHITMAKKGKYSLRQIFSESAESKAQRGRLKAAAKSAKQQVRSDRAIAKNTRRVNASKGMSGDMIDMAFGNMKPSTKAKMKVSSAFRRGAGKAAKAASAGARKAAGQGYKAVKAVSKAFRGKVAPSTKRKINYAKPYAGAQVTSL